MNAARSPRLRLTLLFAEAAAWDRPIRFPGGVGHLPVLQIADQARHHSVRRLIIAHIGRPRCARSTPGNDSLSGNGANPATPTSCLATDDYRRSLQ